MFSIGFLTNDSELVNKFRGIDSFSGFKVIKDLSEANTVDVLIIGEKLINVNELLGKRETLTNKHVFYMAAQHTTINISALESKDIKVIPPKYTTAQAVSYVCSCIFDNVSSVNNVFVFFGADNKVGTSMVSQSVAERMSLDSSVKVFYTCLDGLLDYMDVSFNSSIDSISVKLKSNILSPSELLDSCNIIHDNLYVLQGISYIVTKRHFHPNHIEYFLNLLSKQFDVVIIDAGSNISLGLAIGALNFTPNKFLVTTQQDKSINHFNIIQEQILARLMIKNFLLIVNKTIDDAELPKPIQLADMYKATYLSSIPFYEWGWQCEKEKHTLLKYENVTYNKSIDQIISYISNHLKLNVNIQNNKKSLFGKLFKR